MPAYIATGGRYVQIARASAAWKAYAAANGLSGNWARAGQYSMTAKELHSLYLKQNGQCYLCDKPMPRDLRGATIDHDHSCCPSPRPGYKISCGRCVRGLACDSCNKLIGMARDDPERLRRVADRLEVANRRVSRQRNAGFTSLDGVLSNTPERDIA